MSVLTMYLASASSSPHCSARDSGHCLVAARRSQMGTYRGVSSVGSEGRVMCAGARRGELEASARAGGGAQRGARRPSTGCRSTQIRGTVRDAGAAHYRGVCPAPGPQA
eukprot:scaffold37132_cov57-Phaeocystis_antarctica.AAC.3